MLRLEWEMVEHLVTQDVACNKCGRSCRVEDEHQREVFQFVCVELKVHWGYFSSHDLEAHRSHLCEQCYDELVASFVIPPEIKRCLALDPTDVFDPFVEERARRWEERNSGEKQN